MSTDKTHRLRLHTQIDIQADSETVWRVLTDFAGYPEWNPFVKSLTGEVKPGHTIQVLLQPQTGRAMRFAPKVLSFVPNREFSWLGKLWFKGIFDGEHHFELHPNAAGGVTLHQFECFDGVLVPLLKKSLLRNTKADFERLNLAVKNRAEVGIG